MSSSPTPTPAPHPGSDGEPSASQEEMSAKHDPADPALPIPTQGIPHSAKKTMPAPEHRREERSEGYQTEPVSMPPVPELSPSSINTDVCRRDFDPLPLGIVIGAIAAIIGFLIGVAYYLLLS